MPSSQILRGAKFKNAFYRLKTVAACWTLPPAACGRLRTVTKSWCGCSPPCALCCDGRRAGKVRISRLGDIDLSLMPRPWSPGKRRHMLSNARGWIFLPGTPVEQRRSYLKNWAMERWFYESLDFQPLVLRTSHDAWTFRIPKSIITIIIITRPKPAYGRQGLDWIVWPGYSFVVFSTNKTMETNQKPW